MRQACQRQADDVGASNRGDAAGALSMILSEAPYGDDTYAEAKVRLALSSGYS